MKNCYWCKKELPKDCLETRMNRILFWCSIDEIEKHLKVNTDFEECNVFRNGSYIGTSSELKKEGQFKVIIKTKQPIKYDELINANVTKEEYVLSNYGGLPNEYVLEEQWKNLPEGVEGKPLRHWHTLGKAFRPGAPIRFYLNRLSDVVGVSGTGIVLNGVWMPSGKVVIEWKHPYQTIGIYNDLQEFLDIHVQLQADKSELVFID